MSKPVKEMITRELSERYSGMESAVWVEFAKIDGVSTNEFRRELHGKSMRLEVVSNALFRRACASGPLARLSERMSGPSAIITGGESPVDVAKALESWMKKFDGLRLRGAVIDGELIDEHVVKDLKNMPTKRDMQGRVASAIRSPGARLAGALLAPGGQIAACLKSVIEKLEKLETQGGEQAA